MRGETIIALAFTANLLQLAVPARAQSSTELSGTLIEKIGNDNLYNPDTRAFLLLSIASGYIVHVDQTNVDKQYASMRDRVDVSFSPRVLQRVLTHLANKVASAPKISRSKDVQIISNSSKNYKLADMTILKAVKLTDSTSDLTSKLKLYFIAMRLFEKVGNTQGATDCNHSLEGAVKSCEREVDPNPAHVAAVASVLDAETISILPVSISEYAGQKVAMMTEYSNTDFKKSEKLKLRALALADRLSPGEHVRRLEHRNLALWYQHLGNSDMAEMHKEILYDLVGFRDEKLLYPQSEGCGQLKWWQREQLVQTKLCGMG